MRREILVRAEASADAAQAASWYDQRVSGLGTRLMNELDVALASIRDAPLQYPLYHREVRRARIRGFPYGVFFVATDARVIVLAILHLTRDPRFIRGKLRR